MKTITLLCGIALVLNTAFSGYNFATNMLRLRAGFQSTLLPYVLNQGSWVVAEVCLAAFFFILYTRQKT